MGRIERTLTTILLEPAPDCGVQSLPSDSATPAPVIAIPFAAPERNKQNGFHLLVLTIPSQSTTLFPNHGTPFPPCRDHRWPCGRFCTAIITQKDDVMNLDFKLECFPIPLALSDRIPSVAEFENFLLQTSDDFSLGDQCLAPFCIGIPP